MKQLIVFLLGIKTIRNLTVGICVLISSELFGQSSTVTSYDQNSIPISGNRNTALGVNALMSNTSIGHKNTAIGYSALSSTNGHSNTAVGDSSLGNSVILGNFNTAIGINSLLSNTFGGSNTGLGANANVASGSLNNATAIGSGAVVNASNTIQLGNSSVTAVYAGTGTTASVIAGGLQITGGSLAVGNVLTSDAAGVATWQSPAGNGNWSLTGNAGTVDGTNFIGTTDNVPFNIRVNNETAGRIDESLENSFYGFKAGQDNSVGGKNTAVGFEALLSNTEGSNNTAAGRQALYNNSKGYYNTSIGSRSMYNNTDGNVNTSVGYQALFSNTTGNFNSAFGSDALWYNSTGSYSTALGSGALVSNTTGSSNTATGTDALVNNTTGSENTSLGSSALSSNSTGSYNTALGSSANMSATNLINSTALGSQAISNASNKIRLGNTSVTVVEGPVAYTFSDGRFKNNITDNEIKGLVFIQRLRPVVYNLDTRKIEEFLTQQMPDSIRAKYFVNRDFHSSSAIRQSGFIAQEVEIAAKESGYNFNGLHVPESAYDNYSLAYSQFVVPLVKSVQELSSQNQEMKKMIEEQRVINESMKKEMEHLHEMITSMKNENEKGSIKISTSDPDARLFQNAPNPFDQSTIIRYSLPSTAKKAMLLINTVDGVRVKAFDLKNKGGQTIEISAGQLAAGTYFYSLIIDDKLIDSKTMILTN